MTAERVRRIVTDDARHRDWPFVRLLAERGDPRITPEHLAGAETFA